MHSGATTPIADEVRRGLAADEFSLVFQPQVSLTTGRMVGAEALARWEAPGGLRMPADFVAIAEQSGLIIPLGAFALETAFRRAAVLEQIAPAGFVTWVNVSPYQILEDDVVALVDRALDGSGAAPASVGIEITETALLGDGDRARRVLSDIRSRGIRIALDDFGTGYSSLHSVQEFDIDVLKIAREFVRDLPSDGTARVIVDVIVEVAQALGMETVAEGIETPGQLDAVRSAGCDIGQGFLLGRPMPATALRACLTDDVGLLEQVPA